MLFCTKEKSFFFLSPRQLLKTFVTKRNIELLLYMYLYYYTRKKRYDNLYVYYTTIGRSFLNKSANNARRFLTLLFPCVTRRSQTNLSHVLYELPLNYNNSTLYARAFRHRCIA